jgi:nucleoside phosphorylase
MRLLYTADDGRLGWTDDLVGDQIPPYAILSHTWEGQEVPYKDLQNHKDIGDVDTRLRGGYQKIFFCAAQAKHDGLDYFWVDTCCIDKANNTELSEAINSMFRWYQKAKKCYVYLSDVECSTSTGDKESSRRWKPAFRQSRWFTRGWTLQELLAPASVAFFSKEGELLGSKQSLKDTIHEITGIPSEALLGKQVSEFSVAERFSWAQNRQTTRDEDGAYCLFGMFGCHLPLIYGEGKAKALHRLRREIEAASEDIRGTSSSATRTQMQRQLRREDYTVGWVCALPVERAAAQAMLDEEHAYAARESSDNDDNVYCLGSVAGHNVVIVCLPAGCIGNNPAAAVATQMRAAFKGIRFGLMVGIGGGVPSAEVDIRLGDVVVSQPQWSFGGVVQYDFGRRTPSGLERIGSLNAPPQILLSAVSNIQANKMVGKNTLPDHLSTLERYPAFQRRRAGPDLLFEAAYNHEHGATCDQCSAESRQPRTEREGGAAVTVHYGTIASGNQVMKDAAERDRVSAELGGVLCFEMEAAGLMNSFPCLVIRGISDYADTHKNKQWQAYAAGTAAAYAKELLSAIPPTEVISAPRADDS